MSEALKPCPFCGVELVANNNPADHHVRRYGTHYDHQDPASCFLGGHEVTPAHIDEWNRRAPSPKEPAAERVKQWTKLANAGWTDPGVSISTLQEALRAALATRGPIGAVEPTDEQIYQCYLTMTAQSPIKFARAILALSRTHGAGNAD